MDGVIRKAPKYVGAQGRLRTQPGGGQGDREAEIELISRSQTWHHIGVFLSIRSSPMPGDGGGTELVIPSPVQRGSLVRLIGAYLALKRTQHL